MTWETIESWNVGLDWGLFNNRLTGSFDYYNRYTYDMIGPAPTLPSVLGASAPAINNCDMKSYGWELELSWRPCSTIQLRCSFCTVGQHA